MSAYALFACIPTFSAPPFRYVASEKDKQATFTGAQQRAGVYALPFAVDGIFGFGRSRPKVQSKRKRSRAAAAAKQMREETAGSGFFFQEGAADEEDEELPAGFSFDWDAYRAKFGDTPIQDAITTMFAEYAVLYGRIAGWANSAVPPAMTLAEGKSIADQAEHFVLNIMAPILGTVRTSKVHKLLAHVMDAIRYHGNLRVGNTADNEAAHKDDKPFYRRTNMNLATFTQQLVRKAQGAREVTRKNAVLDSEAYSTLPLVPKRVTGGRKHDVAGGAAGAATPAATAAVDMMAAAPAPRVASAGGDAAATSAPVVGAPTGGTIPAASVSAVASSSAGDVGRASLKRRPTNNLKWSRIGDLSQRPGLAALGQLFKLSPERKVPVLATVGIDATFDCNTKSRQLLRASPHFKNNKPWYDSILFTLGASEEAKDGGDNGGDESAGADGSANADGSGTGERDSNVGVPRAVVHAGEVRAIIRCKEDDYAVICAMDVVDAVPGCPFDVRCCTRLRWAGSASTGPVIRAVPLKHVTRVIHVVPDFKDLASRKGMGAAPACDDGPPADLFAMRYFLNEFYPWGSRPREGHAGLAPAL